MRVWHVVVVTVAAGAAIPIALHYREHDVVNASQIALAFFLWLNAVIALWEICLFLRIGQIEEDYARFAVVYKGRELDRVKDFFGSEIPPRRLLSPALWSEIWSSYAIFDESYANKTSFGFFVDVGNGFTTLIPTLVFLYGMTFERIPARILGIVGLLIFYQMWYGTLVYFGSFLLNKRYVGHTPANLAIFVGLSNGLWLTFPLFGMVASIRMIYDDSYALFLR